MKKDLLDIIFNSEKRKHVLLMLYDGQKEMPFILASLDTTRPALLPQMKILKESNLICQSGDNYRLTNIGKIVVDEMKPFLNTIETLDENSNYLTTHKVGGIPEDFLKRISDIRGYNLVEPTVVNAHEMNSDYLKVALASKAVYFVFTFMHPACPWILGQLADNNINVEIIFTRDLVDKLIEGWSEEFRHYIAYDNVKFYIYEKEVGISSLTVTDAGFLLRLLFSNDEFSNKQVLCLSPQGRQWGKELFDYYLKDAKPINHV
jgi:Predicted transcriptional regulator